ncbi:hypothetical protein [Shouchella clausii]|uniref:hypothetical protein n=1 Tax=Shouchella clausii TaxID=79880 RepID=UPI001C73384A|nr:hypothetical protein [Shouchella clausii]MBX0320216.1 hypothetical protein [Shouchella clausii]
MAKRIIPHTLVDGEYIPHDAAAINDGTERIDAKRVIKIEREITDQKSHTSPLKHGLNAVDSDQASVTDLVIEGRTLINLVPYSSNYYEVSAIEGISEQIGNSWRFTRRDNDGHIQGRPSPISNDYKIEAGKCYIAIGTVEVVQYGGQTTSIGTPTSPRITVRPRDTLSTTLVQGSDIDTTPGTISVSYALFKASEDKQVFIQAEILRANANDQFILHNVSLYELTEADYQSSLTLGAEEIAAKYSYVDGIKHVKNPALSKSSKNLLQKNWTIGNIGVSNGNITIGGSLGGTNSFATCIETIPVIPGEQYVLNLEGHAATAAIIFLDANFNVVGNYHVAELGKPFTIVRNAHYIRMRSISNNPELVSPFIEENAKIQLSIGNISQPYERYNTDYLYFETNLGSSSDGSVCDLIFKKNGKYILREHFIKDYLIDENVSDISVSQRTDDYTEITIRDFSGQLEFSAGGKHVLVDSNGVIYPQVSGQSNQSLSGTFVLGVSSCWIRIPNAYSGWAESPTLSQIRDFLTQKPFKLTYQLKNPIEKEIETEGAISLHKGPNLLTLNSGLILNEQIEPKRYHAANKAWYGINYIGSIETAHSPLQNEARRIVDIKADGKSVYHLFQSTSKGDLQNEVAYGLDYARIQESDFDPEASYTVTYFPLDNRTPPIEKSSITYQTSVSSSLNKTVEKLTDVETSVSVQANQLVELLARVRALDS